MPPESQDSSSFGSSRNLHHHLRAEKLSSSLRPRPSFSGLRNIHKSSSSSIPRTVSPAAGTTSSHLQPSSLSSAAASSSSRSKFLQSRAEPSKIPSISLSAPQIQRSSSSQQDAASTLHYTRTERKPAILPKPMVTIVPPTVAPVSSLRPKITAPSKHAAAATAASRQDSRIPSTRVPAERRLRNVIKRKNSQSGGLSAQNVPRSGSTTSGSAVDSACSTASNSSSSKGGISVLGISLPPPNAGLQYFTTGGSRRRSGSMSSTLSARDALGSYNGHYGTSPSPFSELSQSSSISSVSSNLPPSSSSSLRVRQPSPTRPSVVSRNRSGSASSRTSNVARDSYMDTVRESTTSASSSSASTIRAAPQLPVSESRKASVSSETGPRSPPLHPKVQRQTTYPPPALSNSAPNTPFMPSRSPRIPSPLLPQKTPSPNPQALGTFRSKSSNAVPVMPAAAPVRPSREGTPELNLNTNQAMPVIQTNIQRTRSRSTGNSVSQLPMRRPSATVVGPPPTTSVRRPSIPRGATPVPPSSSSASSTATPTTKRSESTDRQRGVSPAPSKLVKPSLFSRGRSRNTSDTPEPEKLRKCPTAGTGHEGYGSWGRSSRGRSSSGASQTGNSWSRSGSTSSQGGGGRGSTGDGQGKNSVEIDDFLADRTRPVVLAGGQVVENQNLLRRPSEDGGSAAGAVEMSRGGSMDSRSGRRTPGSACEGSSDAEKSRPRALQKKKGAAARPVPAPIDTKRPLLPHQDMQAPVSAPLEASRQAMVEPQPSPKVSSATTKKSSRWNPFRSHTSPTVVPTAAAAVAATPTASAAPAIRVLPGTTPQTQQSPPPRKQVRLPQAHYVVYDAVEQREAAQLEEMMLAKRERQKQILQQQRAAAAAAAAAAAKETDEATAAGRAYAEEKLRHLAAVGTGRPRVLRGPPGLVHPEFEGKRSITPKDLPPIATGVGAVTAAAAAASYSPVPAQTAPPRFEGFSFGREMPGEAGGSEFMVDFSAPGLKSTPVNGEEVVGEEREQEEKVVVMTVDREEEEQVDPLDPTPVQASPKIRDWLPFRNPSVGLAVVEGGEKRIEGEGERKGGEEVEDMEDDWSEYDELFGDEEEEENDAYYHRVSHASSLGDAFQYSSDNLLLDAPKESGQDSPTIKEFTLPPLTLNEATRPPSYHRYSQLSIPPTPFSAISFGDLDGSSCGAPSEPASPISPTTPSTFKTASFPSTTASLAPGLNIRLLSLTTTQSLLGNKLLLTPPPPANSRVLILDATTDDYSYYFSFYHPHLEVYNLSATPIPAPNVDRPHNHMQIPHALREDVNVALPFPGGFFQTVLLRFARPRRWLVAEARRVLARGGNLEVMGVFEVGREGRAAGGGRRRLWLGRVSGMKGWEGVKGVKVELGDEGDVGKVGRWWGEKVLGVGEGGRVGWEVVVARKK